MNLSTNDLFTDTARLWWGLRGDPVLWDALRDWFATKPWPTNSVEFEQQLKAAFAELTTESLDEGEKVYVEQLNQGGMSGGWVSKVWWRERGFPILLKRYRIAVWRRDHELEKLAD